MAASQPADESRSRAHVIVVGGGLAGLVAAISAAEAGAHVTLLEKEKNIGGK
jgi:phytoene dehydrogenase-like protein